MTAVIWMVVIMVALNIGLRLMHRYRIAVGFRTEATGVILAALSVVEAFDLASIVPDDSIKVFVGLIGATMINLRWMTTTPARKDV